MRNACLLVVVALGILAVSVPAYAQPQSTAFVSLPFRCLHPDAVADTVGYNAAHSDSIQPTGNYLWAWTIECASSDDADGLRYWFQPVGWDTSAIVRDTLEPGRWYTWDCGVQWIKCRGIGAAVEYRIRFHQD